MKQTLWFLLMLTAMMLTACSSDDDDNNGTEDDAAELAQIREKQQANLMVNALCKYDSLTATYKPRIGEAINAPTPTIYYAVANTVEEARSRYESIVGVTRTDVTDASALPNDMTHGDVHLTFAPSTADGETARITVDCLRLKDVLTAIIFIPESAWPENKDLASPFGFLSAWYQPSIGINWICVREARGSDGLLLTFDGGWWYTEFDKYTHHQGYFWLYKDLADSEAIKCLAEGIRNSPDKFNAMVKKLGEHNSNSGTYKILNRLKNNEYITFDLSFDWDYHLWKAYHCYDVTVYRCAITQSHAFITGSNYYTHEDTPTRCEPSHHATFDRGYDNKDNKEWVAIYR